MSISVGYLDWKREGRKREKSFRYIQHSNAALLTYIKLGCPAINHREIPPPPPLTYSVGYIHIL